MVFDQKKIDLPDGRLETNFGHYIFSRQKELILELVKPQAGERMLGISYGISNYLDVFREKRCSATGIVLSAAIPKAAAKKMDNHLELYPGQADELPFSDDEFDIVTIINVLGIAQNPQKVIAEAIRVCRGRIFIGFLNKYSFVGSKQRLKEIFGFPLSENIRFFSIDEIRKMVSSLMDNPAIKWGSVIYFPIIVYNLASELEEMVPSTRNPLGAFVGLTFPVKYTYRTAQSPLTESYELKRDAQVTAPEAVRGMLKETAG